MQHIFITGGTGFLGWNLTRNLLTLDENKVYLLVRSKNNQQASNRINQLLVRHCGKKDVGILKKRIELVEGDVTLPRLGIEEDKERHLLKEINVIYHCAALCEFGIPLELIRKINVEGTRNVLDFALKCKKQGNFSSFNHISTVGIVGKTGGVFYEDCLDIGQTFNNTYEQTKFEAEKLVEKYRQKGLSITVFRPSLITGDSMTGEVSNFKMFYQPLHIFSLGLFDEIPANKTLFYNLVPVDVVAKAIYLISSKNVGNKNYHLSNSEGVTLEYFLNIASSYFGFKMPRVVKESEFNYNRLVGFRKKLLEPYIPYFTHRKVVFDVTNFKQSMNGTNFEWPKINRELLLTLFKYCDKVGYIKRKKVKNKK